LKFRVLATLPLLLAVIFAATSLALGDRMPVAIGTASEVGKVFSLAGAIIAALAFERGDYLRKAWLRYGACYVFLLANDALALVNGAGNGLFVARGLVVTVGNACAVWGTWMLARAWTVAGLEEEGDERRRKRTMFVGAALLSLAITGWPLFADVRLLLGGDPIAVVSIASDLGDILTLALIAPVMHTALAMRGGLLLWPWGLLTLSNCAWIAYDASSGATDHWQLGPGVLLAASESLRVLANGWVLAAGIAQRLAVNPGKHSSQPPPPP
jgi:hypothetical protein